MHRSPRFDAVYSACLLAWWLSGPAAFAQQSASDGPDTWIAAKPIERDRGTYPLDAILEKNEGWVVVSYVISPAGEVIEPMIEDSSGVEILEEEALRTVSDWRYEPAKRNGVPVEQSMMNVQLRYVIGERGVGRDFKRAYDELVALMDGKDFEAARPLLEKLEFGGRTNLTEDAWFWWLNVAYLEGTKSTDDEAKITALARAMGYFRDDLLDRGLFVVASERLFALQVQKGDLAAARWVYERLRDSRTAFRSSRYRPAMDAMTPVYEQIQQIIAGDGTLVMSAEITNHAYWVHALLRRSFSMAEIVGRVDVVDIRCLRGTKRYDSFPADALWQVPESWGDCGVYIKGEPGTTFKFEEYSAAALGAPTSD
jgi:TonB family protein